jgi:tripartite-type tricarboxylate transporter receptor subunit TctC
MLRSARCVERCVGIPNDMKVMCVWCAALVLAMYGSPAPAQDNFPSRQVRIIVPFPAGGSSDIVARLFSLRLGQLWGREIVIDNRPGSGSVEGVHLASQAVPDGHTLVATNVSLAINEAVSPRLPYHAVRDFSPISLLAHQYTALVAPPAYPASNVAQLIELARTRPVIFYSSGVGSAGHLVGELLRATSGAGMTHVPVPSVRRSIIDAAYNPAGFAIVGLPSALPQVASGKLKVLAVTTANRAAVLPDVPTVGETIPGFEAYNWIGVLAPYGISVKLVRRINRDIASILDNAEFRTVLANHGYDPIGSTPGDFQRRLVRDIERYTRDFSAAGVRRALRTP